MKSESVPCLDPLTTTGELRAWSEDRLTARARAIWSGADFLPIARSFAPGAAQFVSRLKLNVGERVLDVACGTGNLAIPAARAGARVTGIDIAPNLIAQAQREAERSGLAVTFEVGDAECLPYVERQFDTTVSMFGAMFAYRPARAASELIRVTRHGGRIAMANWTPDSFVGRMLKAHVAVAPPPAGIPSPLMWGDEAMVRDRFGDRVHQLSMVQRTIQLSFPIPPAAVTELFATSYGPTVAALAAADPEGRRQLRDALTTLFSEHDLAGGDNTVVASAYLDVEGVVA